MVREPQNLELVPHPVEVVLGPCCCPPFIYRPQEARPLAKSRRIAIMAKPGLAIGLAIGPLAHSL